MTALLPTAQEGGVEGLQASESRPLFDGRTLAGWRGALYEHPREFASLEHDAMKALREDSLEAMRASWQVEDGALVSEVSQVFLTSDGYFSDFELMLDYGLGDGGHAGVYLRGSAMLELWGDGPRAMFMASKDPRKRSSGGLYSNSLKRTGVAPLVTVAQDEWNRLRVVMCGSSVWAWINDVQVLRGARAESQFYPWQPIAHAGPVQFASFQEELRLKHIGVRRVVPGQVVGWLATTDGEGFERIAGEDLEAPVDSAEPWEIDGDVLSAPKGAESILVTRDVFGDFTLRFDYRLTEGARGGIGLRTPGGAEPLTAGLCEIVLFDDIPALGTDRGLADWNAAARGLEPAWGGYAFPVDTWNAQEITVRAQRVQVELNGTLVLDAKLDRLDLSPEQEAIHTGVGRRQGHIALASYGKPFEIRNLRIRREDDLWPDLEPFLASRLWEVTELAGGLEPGERHTPESVEGVTQMIELMYGVFVETDQTVAEMFDEAPKLEVDSVERAAWFQMLPFVMHALEPLWNDDAWSEDDKALAGACAVVLAREPDLPRLELGDDPASNREQLRRLAESFRELASDPVSYSQMILQQDYGPYAPIPVDPPAEVEWEGTMWLGWREYVRVGREQGSGRQLFEVVTQDGAVSHRVHIADVPDDMTLSLSDARGPIQLGSYGWRAHMRFGVPGDMEMVILYLDADLRPLFYFCTW